MCPADAVLVAQLPCTGVLQGKPCPGMATVGKPGVVTQLPFCTCHVVLVLEREM